MGTMHDDEAAAIAAFLRRRGATVVPTAAAYGVDPEADRLRSKERRRQERLDTRMAEEADHAEHESERLREEVSDAYMGGGSRAVDEVLGMRSWGRPVRRARR